MAYSWDTKVYYADKLDLMIWRGVNHTGDLRVNWTWQFWGEIVQVI